MIDFEHSLCLEDERVRLRSLQNSDFQHLLPFSLNEPGIWKYSLLSAAGKVNLENYFAQALEGRKNKVQLPFIVFDKQTQEYAGSTRYYDIQENNQSLQLGYTWYGKKFQGSGLNKRCKFLLLDYAFDTLKMQRVEFRADNNNVRSIAAMKSIGCTVEGILRSNCLTDQGTRRDSIVLSILRNEWFGGLKDSLKRKIEE
jgi:RimJ/RimL family protein N-acetyltransferase